MSTTYSIACRECRKHLWIAQSSGDSQTLYSGGNYTPALKDFFFDHIGHPLVFHVNCDGEIAEMEEIEIPFKPTCSSESDSDRIRKLEERNTRLLSAGNALAKEAFERGIGTHVEAWDEVAKD